MAKNEAITIIPEEVIINKIYYFRGLKVMLDSDLAELYGIETKVLNQSVSRNLKRFPPDFMFQLNKDEWTSLRSQFVTASWSHRRTEPYVFTEHGVLMLSSILNSARAIEVNIQVMRIFTRIRQALTDNIELRLEIEHIKKKVANHDKNIELVFHYLDQLLEKKERPVAPRKRIGYKPDTD